MSDKNLFSSSLFAISLIKVTHKLFFIYTCPNLLGLQEEFEIIFVKEKFQGYGRKFL